MTKEIDEKQAEELTRLDEVLAPLGRFFDQHSSFNFIEFDYYTIHDLTLFTVEPNFDFDGLKSTLEKINLALPAIKRIFAKPIINLTDASDVLPVETVRIINQETMQHLANHTENASDITDKGVKPRQLLTRVYEDDYSIYENVIFCNLIDAIMHYIRSNVTALKDMVYANEILQFNLLERSNHLNYFLTIGKLHTGYIRDYEKYFALADQLYGELQSIANIIQPRLVKPIYQKNKIRNQRLALKKTNIFIMQKDYHQVYKLAKVFLVKKDAVVVETKPVDEQNLRKNYFNFVQTLIVFAITQFNFEADPKAVMDLRNLNLSLGYKTWKVHLSNLEGKAMMVEVGKEKTYRLLFLPTLDGLWTAELEELAAKYPHDEALLTEPFEEETLDPAALFISVEAIDSFRRIQQVLLRAMVKSDAARDECPFCGGKLHKRKKDGGYECDSCHTLIQEAKCPKTGEAYTYTDIASYKKIPVNPALFGKNEMWRYYRKVEASLFFRNITKITPKGEFVCPVCHEVHPSKN
jgi:ribosomal protein L37AE/L43A